MHLPLTDRDYSGNFLGETRATLVDMHFDDYMLNCFKLCCNDFFLQTLLVKGVDRIPFVLSYESEMLCSEVFKKMNWLQMKETGASYRDPRKGTPGQQRQAHGEQIRSILIKHEASIKVKSACFTIMHNK